MDSAGIVALIAQVAFAFVLAHVGFLEGFLCLTILQASCTCHWRID